MAIDSSDFCHKMGDYERHFNTIQAGLRGLASTWTLAGFAGLSFFLHPEVDKQAVYSLDLAALTPSAYLAMSMIATAVFGGLLVLWILDQLVYHRLLLAAFFVGLSVELKDVNMPPLRWIMAASDSGKKVPDRIFLFYLVPMAVFLVVSISMTLLMFLLPIATAGSMKAVAVALNVAGLWGLTWLCLKRGEPRLSYFVGQWSAQGVSFPKEVQQWFSPLAKARNLDIPQHLTDRLRAP